MSFQNLAEDNVFAIEPVGGCHSDEEPLGATGQLRDFVTESQGIMEKKMETTIMGFIG